MSYDNACKFLAESAPADFLRCFFSVETTDIQVLKTELTVEPIRADSVSFLQTASQIQHLEFETLPYSAPPIPLRMLDYYTRLKRQYRCEIEQLVIFLKQTTSELVFVDEYTDTNTRHRYRVIRLWEQDPGPFLATPALLPLAPLTRTDSPVALLEQVAAEIATISEEASAAEYFSVRPDSCRSAPRERFDWPTVQRGHYEGIRYLSRHYPRRAATRQARGSSLADRAPAQPALPRN